MKITEKLIGKAGLTSQEAMVVRVFYDLPAAGKRKSRTRNWVEKLSPAKHAKLLNSAERKIQKAITKSKAGK